METKQLDVYKEWLGIPEGPRPPDHYTLLRLVQFEDDEEKIRRNYTKLNEHVRKYATGQYSAESQALLNELAKAMLCLTDPQRKREYDAGLGREPEEKPGAIGRQSLTDILVEQGHVSSDQAAEAQSFAEARGLSLRDAVVQMKLVDADTATRAFAAELGYSHINLNDTLPDDSVLDKVPRNLVKRHQILPLFIDEDTLLVACVHEPVPELEEELRLRYGVPMRPVMATPLAVNQGIAKYYAPGMRDEAVAEEAAAGTSKKTARKSQKKDKPKKADAKDSAAEPDDAYQQKLLGVLVILWSFGGCALLDAFLLFPYLGFSLIKGYFTTVIVAPLLAVWAYFHFFRK